jgi:hypothetical protein
VPHADAPLCPAARGPVLLQSHQLPGGPRSSGLSLSSVHIPSCSR